MLDDGNWQQVAMGTSPSGYFGWTLTVPLPFPADYLEFSLLIPSNPDWKRAGYFRQLWSPGGEAVVLYSRIIYQENRIFKIEPISSFCFLSFTALSYVKDFNYQIVARYLE